MSNLGTAANWGATVDSPVKDIYGGKNISVIISKYNQANDTPATREYFERMREYLDNLKQLANPSARGLSFWQRRIRERQLRNIVPGLAKFDLALMYRLPTMLGTWYAKHTRFLDGEILDYGLSSAQIFVTSGVGAIVDAWQNSLELEAFKYHGLGTGSTAPVIGNTALGAECTTTLNPDSTRATGTTTEGASANIFRSVGVNTFDSNPAVAEAGIFNQASTAGGTMMDRGLIGPITPSSGDTITTTWDATFTAGS